MMQLNLFSEKSNWKPLRAVDLPYIRGRGPIGVDTETHDPGLLDYGPGFIKGTGYVLGVSVAVKGFATYLPLRHYANNVEEPEGVTRWLRDMLKGDDVKLGANIHYDMDSLKTIGISLNGQLWDVQMVDALIDERHKSYSLDNIAKRRLGRGKTTDSLKQTLIDHKLTMSDLRLLEADKVADYATDDAAILLDILNSQKADIDKWELHEALKRETQLTRVLWDMHQKGIRIDVSAAEKANEDLHKQANEYLLEAGRLAPVRVVPDSPKAMAALCRAIGVDPLQTAKGNDSITNDFLRSSGHPVLSAIYQYRRINKIRRDFIEGIFLDYNINGRIHPQWFQLRHSNEGDDDESGGAATGRITGQKPNLTQIPSRDPVLGPMCRSIVLPDEGFKYAKADFSSQEPRWTLHFACKIAAVGAENAKRLFLQNKATDFHQITRDMVEDRSGVNITRRQAKDINLGLTYGMGKWKLANKLGLDIEAATVLINVYHDSVPFIREVASKAAEIASERGFVRTWGGRLRHFDEWESTDWEQKGIFATREECMEYYGNARRAKTHKALNSIVQGTGADQMKQAIINCWSEDEMPLLQVYDECGFNVLDEKHARKLCDIMEEALQGEIPALVEPEIGTNWGNLRKVK